MSFEGGVKVIMAKGFCFHPLRLHRNSRKFCKVSENTQKDGDLPMFRLRGRNSRGPAVSEIRPSQSYKLKRSLSIAFCGFAASRDTLDLTPSLYGREDMQNAKLYEA